MEPHHHYGLLILAVILSLLGYTSYTVFTDKPHIAVSMHAGPGSTATRQAPPDDGTPGPASGPASPIAATPTDFNEFYALSRGVMALDHAYRFPACLYYHDGQLAIGPTNIYSDKMIFSAHFHLKHHQEMSALLHRGGIWCGKIVARMGKSGSIAVIDFH